VGIPPSARFTVSHLFQRKRCTQNMHVRFLDHTIAFGFGGNPFG
jgi:hypothetical protein